MRFLLVNAYPCEGRAALDAAGATQPDILYRRLLAGVVPNAAADVLYPADADAHLPAGAELSAYAGILWSGSSLTIHADDDPRVQRQIDFVRAVYRAGVPSFGSCWAAQIAVTAAGGRCAANPRGREFGLTTPIELTDVGAAHALYRGKPRRFVALTSHADEVVSLPRGAELLASNAFSRVQAVAVRHEHGSFWAVQYHPEYDLHEVARLAVLRADELIRQGTFADRAAAERYIDTLECAHRGELEASAAQRLGLAAPDLTIAQRSIELQNWIAAAVRGA